MRRALKRLWRARRRRIIAWPLRLCCLVIGLYLTSMVTARILPKAPLSRGFPQSVAVTDARGELLRLTLASDETFRRWVSLKNIAPALKRAFLLYEDRDFYRHPGFDPLALSRATMATLLSRSGRKIGGSTITMQLARRLYGLKTRSIGGKLGQIARAVYLEFRYTKDEILEAYLNLAPFGGNVEGVEAASRVYFGRSASALTLAEALTLAVIPQNPKKRCPCANRRALARARSSLWQRWSESFGAQTPAYELLNAQRLPPLRKKRDLPFLAPHFVDHLLQTRASSVAASRSATIASTLDLSLQRLLERRLTDYVARRRSAGLVNAAALLVDRRDMSVRATLGSARYHDRAIAGQVDGTRAFRSAASTIKPFIFALALEQGLLHPETLLRDAPANFSGYRPENFDRRFSGPISATDALVRSRNIPALDIASKLIQPTLYQFLEGARITRLRDKSSYGLALALGGVEMSMSELVGLYAALANGGLLRPLRSLRSTPTKRGRRVLSAGASFVTLEMLRRNPRPREIDLPLPHHGSATRVPWKSGTSNGLHDAWAVGVFEPYVLAVWVGNFAPKRKDSFVGREAAAPLFFEIGESLAAAGRVKIEAAKQPPIVRRISVCALSGRLPNADCPHHKKTFFIAGRSPISTCTIHRRVLIDRRSGRRRCGGRQGDPKLRGEVYEFWSTEMRTLFRLAGLPRRRPPAADSSCSVATQSQHRKRPVIRSPLAQVTYFARRQLRTGKTARVALQADADGDARRVYWFVGDRFLGRREAGQTFWWSAPPGRYTLRAVDDAGRVGERSLLVRDL